MQRKLMRAGLVGAPLAALIAAGTIWAVGGSASGASTIAPDWTGDPSEVAAALNNQPWHNPAASSDGIGKAGPQPSLEFPPGTTYSAALSAIYMATAEGALPTGATLGKALAPGKVVRAESGGTGIAVSLTAPFGYDIRTGNIVTPIFEQADPDNPRPTDAEVQELWDGAQAVPPVIPSGFRVAGSTLVDCQVDAPKMPATCSAANVSGTLTVFEVAGGIGPVVTGDPR